MIFTLPYNVLISRCTCSRFRAEYFLLSPTSMIVGTEKYALICVDGMSVKQMNYIVM